MYCRDLAVSPDKILSWALSNFINASFTPLLLRHNAMSLSIMLVRRSKFAHTSLWETSCSAKNKLGIENKIERHIGNRNGIANGDGNGNEQK